MFSIRLPTCLLKQVVVELDDAVAEGEALRLNGGGNLAHSSIDVGCLTSDV